MVVEARLLGCDVVLNEHVGVAGEPFWTADRAGALEFLLGGPKRFWKLVEELLADDAATPRPVTALEKSVNGLSRLLPRPVARSGRGHPAAVRATGAQLSAW